MTEFSYQLYSSRNFPPLADTLRMVANAGYTGVEGYGALYANADDLGRLRADLDANGLKMPTGHFGLDMVREQPGRVLEIVRALGLDCVFIPAVGPDQREQDAAGWEALGRTLAEAGKPLRDAGVTFGWHNHAFEFADLGGADKPLDLILAGGDLAFEFDVAWAVVGGQDPHFWIDKYRDRIVAAHVKDIAPAGEKADEDGWADVGTGTLDWPALMTALRGTPCRHFVMEHDNPGDDRRFAEASIAAAKTY